MDTVQRQNARVKVDLGLALASRVWDDFCRRTGRTHRRVTAVTPLKSQRLASKSGAYRLEGAAEDGSAVVAKRCRRSTACVEREVYERILPHVGVPRLRYHGYAEEAETGFCWLFLEDAGHAALLESERALAAEWVARLHRETTQLVDQVSLPERGPDHYRQHLGSARASVSAFLSCASVPEPDSDLPVLQRLLRLLDHLDSEWETMCAPCAGAPRTLVHGDFGKKNLRTRVTSAGTELVVLDWETAGWGPIAADLPQMHVRALRKVRPGKPLTWRGTVALDVYAAHSSGAWDGGKLVDLARLAAVGTIFRYVSSIRWAAEQVQSGGMFKPMGRLRLYTAELPQAIAAVECERPFMELYE